MQPTKTSFHRPRDVLSFMRVWPVLFLLWICSSASGQHSNLDLAKEVRNAETIVVGKAISVRHVGPTQIEIGGHFVSAKTFNGQIQVDRVLKGTRIPNVAEIQFELPNSSAGSLGYSGIAIESYRMFFLKRSDKHFVFANPYLPSLPAISRSPATESSEPLEAVLSQLRQVIESPQAAETVKVALIYRLGSTSSDAIIRILTPELANANPTIRGAASAALLEKSYLPALRTAQEILVRPPAGVPKYILLNLSSAIGRYVSDERAIPPLSMILKSPIVQARRSAADALRKTGSGRALSGLASALNDSDLDVRYFAVIGLGEITRQPEWRPLRDDFVQNEERYLGYWRNWTASHVE